MPEALKSGNALLLKGGKEVGGPVLGPRLGGVRQLIFVLPFSGSWKGEQESKTQLSGAPFDTWQHVRMSVCLRHLNYVRWFAIILSPSLACPPRSPIVFVSQLGCVSCRRSVLLVAQWLLGSCRLCQGLRHWLRDSAKGTDCISHALQT